MTHDRRTKMTDFYHKIEDFLENRLPSEEKKAFEEALKTDPDLAAETELARLELDAQDLLVEQNLREKMSDWQTERAAAPTASGQVWKKWLPILLFLGIAGAFALWPRKPKPSPEKPVQPTVNQPIATQPQHPEPQSPKTQNPTLNPQTSNPKPETRNAQIASASWEALINSQLRSSGGAISVVEPKPSAKFSPGKKGEVTVRFSGSFEPENEGEGLRLSVFDNQHKTPLFSGEIPVRKEGQKLVFDFLQNLKLPAGLFYYSVDNQDGELVWVGRFWVE